MKNNKNNKPVLNVSGVSTGRLKPLGLPNIKGIKVKPNKSKSKP